MVYLLSYAHMAFGSSGNMQVHSKVESSVRKLFSELAKSQKGSMKSVATVQKQLPKSYVPAPRYFRKNVEMKKGDWICASLMNFVNNKQCLQCDEHQPKKFLIGGEWECPQCNFCNFSKNEVCLRCDCKKPGVNQFLGPTSDLGLRADKSSVEGNAKKIKAGIEHEQQWFSKIAELEKSSDMSSALAYEDLNETMKAGDNSFAANTRNSGIDRDQINLRTNDDESSINVNINQSLDKLIGQKTSPYESNKGDDGNKSRASSFPGMSSFASQLEQHNEPKAVLDTDAPVQQMSSEKSLNQLENKDYERDQAETSERWSTKVEELHEVKGLPNAVSDGDFPEIMPMRKGESQFVVSKKKDRSLTSPIYKRRVAMEQARKNNYVPFVPFPPGYFAKGNSQEGSDSTHSDEQSGAMSLESGGVGERKEGESSSPVLEASNNMNENPITFDLQYNSPDDYSKSLGTSENACVKASWGERSLEGSAVKETNPLDMSEEAKAERWFQRVAQIKDISELSQIPDEDFPSIMPMRKGVNRFVVSKRKTPLERRLTSPHYRRNLPVADSGPIKKETDSD